MSTAYPSNLVQCRGKLRYENYGRARAGADAVVNRGILKPYACTACGGYHNGRLAHSVEKRPKAPAYESRCDRRYGPEEMRGQA